MNKTFSVVLAVTLIAVIVYSVVVTRDRDALNTELESVETVLTSTQAELVSTQTELSSITEKLSSVQSELEATKTELDAIDAKLKLYEDTMGIKIFSGIQQPPWKGASPIKLVNNPTATDPSWQQLISFLRADPTDDRTWTEGIFVSGDFANMLHDNAEAAGIRAAWVGVRFEGETIGHGLNAFKTTDRGLVYVETQSDAIAYVTKGKEYGIISLGQNTLLDYASYEKMKGDWRSYPSKLEAYNQEVAEYNSAYSRYKSSLEKGLSSPDSSWRQLWLQQAELIQRLFELRYGRTFEAEEKYLEEQREWLNSIRAQLEDLRPPMGIVERIVIYW